ncbi:MAG: class I SAM-dependent methyltransferase [Gemmatimonadaceae bacterium]|nr:class I SAM-dependent methyltransferase [Gemmatimonadaceae bacterium]
MSDAATPRPLPPAQHGAHAAATPVPHDPNAELFDQYADNYDAVVAKSVAMVGGDVAHYARRKADVLRQVLAPGRHRILDFGCGVGALSFSLCTVYPDAEVTGTDTSADSIERAAATAASTGQPRARFARGTESALPAGIGTFDAAVAACVFHHIPPAARAGWMARIFDALDRDGIFMMFEHNPGNPLTLRAVDACPFDADAVLLTHRETVGLFEAAGFVDVRVIHYLFLPPALYGLRPVERLLRWLPIGGQFAVVGRHP